MSQLAFLAGSVVKLDGIGRRRIVDGAVLMVSLDGPAVPISWRDGAVVCPCLGDELRLTPGLVFAGRLAVSRLEAAFVRRIGAARRSRP